MSDIKIKDNEEISKNIEHYRKTLMFLGGNVPIQALCLPLVIENVLMKNGYERVYDLIGTNLTKIKGLGRERIALLTSRLDEFFTVSI